MSHFYVRPGPDPGQAGDCRPVRPLWLRPLSVLLSGMLLLLLTACATPRLQDHDTYLVDVSRPAVSQNSRVRYLVFHYTVGEMPHAAAQLTGGPVSAHYLVPRIPAEEGDRPVVLQLVPETERAWHAGVSFWQGRTSLNDSSIGVEIVNHGPTTETADGKLSETWQPYTPAQIDLIAHLAADIVQRHKIAPAHILGHSDIAPMRKRDPGPLFPWRQLAEAGVGAWPDAAAVTRFLSGRPPQQPVDNIGLLQARLRLYGYGIVLSGELDTQTVHVLQAFQMHFRAADYRGLPDVETQAILQALLEKYPPEEE